MASYEYDSQNQELKRIAGGTLYADMPIGFILPSFETVAPLGFLKLTDTLANRTVSRTTYKELFDWATSRNLIGTGKPFGIGDGSTTFVIPDGKEIAFKGVGEYEGTVGAHVKSGGLAVGEFIDDRLQEHTHNVGAAASGGSAKFGFASKNAQVLSYEEPTSSNTGRKGATTEVKSVGCHYYIKAKQIGVPADFASAIEDVVDNSIINRAGTFTVTLSANGYTNVDVQLGQTLPNTDYILQFSALSTGSILFTEMSRTTSEVRVNVRNLNDANLTITCEWHLICKR